MPRLERAFVIWRRWRARTITKIRRIQIILASNPDQREQGIAPGIGQRGPHPVRASNLRNGTNWPMGGDPFA